MRFIKELVDMGVDLSITPAGGLKVGGLSTLTKVEAERAIRLARNNKEEIVADLKAEMSSSIKVEKNSPEFTAEAVLIRSDVLGEHIWLSKDKEAAAKYYDSGIGVYLLNEVPLLNDKSHEALKLINRVKKIFPGAELTKPVKRITH